MPQDILARAQQQAAQSEPAVRAAALLHIARVLSVFDREGAVRVLDDGLAIATALSGLDRECILSEAVVLSATVNPERALRLVESESSMRFRHHIPERLVQTLLDYGYIEQAASYLIGAVKDSEYPFVGVSNVIQKCNEEAMRTNVLRSAIHAWRTFHPDRTESAVHQFLVVFSRHWQMLPREEARQLTAEIVSSIIGQPDTPIGARINDVEFSSMQQFHLFDILNVLRQLEPELTDWLLPSRPQLAAAAARYPLGIDSIMNEPHPSAAPAKGEGFVMGGFGGSSNDLPQMIAMFEAQRRGNFEPMLREALRLYSEDSAATNPNRAPRACWPSTQAFRDLLYSAGKSLGREVAAYLDRIPDQDIRLFAEIEFAAALASLGQVNVVRVVHRPRTASE